MVTIEPLLRLLQRAIDGGYTPAVLLYVLADDRRTNHELARATRLPLFLVATLRRLAYIDARHMTAAVLFLKRAEVGRRRLAGRTDPKLPA